MAFIALIAGLAVLAGLETGFGTAFGATTERVVVNRYSGLAIEGFDPVAYFADARAVRGLADYEAAAAGAVWRFRNDSNRSAFVAHPDIYGPQFGGYDPIDLARGVAYAGNPLFCDGQRPAALSVRPRGKPHCFCRRSRPLRQGGHLALARRAADPGAIGLKGSPPPQDHPRQ